MLNLTQVGVLEAEGAAFGCCLEVERLSLGFILSFIKKQSQQTRANTLANYVKICLECADVHFGAPGSDVN